MPKKPFLKITLKSDLCPGSGFAFAGVIDADVQYDRYGIPCISGRSLKGCLRESAVTFLGLKDDELIKLFGVGGSDKLTGIQIGNAEPEGAQQLRDEIGALTEDYKKYAGTQNILAYYTNVRAQTSIDAQKGSAKENTLRFTRVINHYINDREMVFYAPIEYDLDDASKNTLKNIVKATRHIGSNRNRGLGNVIMELVDLTEEQSDLDLKAIDRSKKQKITFCVKNIAPLMLSQAADSSTESYIGGNLVLGALAGRYLSIDGHLADDQAFKDLFLSEKTQYSNLTLAAFLSEDGKEKWVASEPVPMYIMRKKKTKDYVNLLMDAEHRATMKDEDKKKDVGNQPKKLRDHWLFRDENGQPMNVSEVEKDIVYHHAKHKANSKGQEGLLYYFETIAPGQYFAGNIIVDGCYTDLMLDLLKMGDFHFGKSRTAQYGTCKLIKIEDPKELDDKNKSKNAGHSMNGNEDTKKYKNNERIVVTFLSDAIFTDESGNDTVKSDEVRSIAARLLRISSAEDQDQDVPYDFLMTKVITGYNTKWNLQRPQRMGIKAGSALIFKLEEEAEIKVQAIGENQREGFGRFRIDRLDTMEYDLNIQEEKDKPDSKGSNVLGEAMVQVDAAVLPFLKASILDSLYKGMLQPVFNGMLAEKINITASSLGRLTLMLTEVQDEEKDPEKRFELLKKRLDSFKDVDKLKENREFVNKILGSDKESVISKLTQHVQSDYDMLKKLIEDDQADNEVYALWPQYLNAVLTCQKYRMKEA